MNEQKLITAVFRPLLAPLEYIDDLNQSVAISHIDNIFYKSEILFEIYLAVDGIYNIKNRTMKHVCSVYILHSILTSNYYFLLKKIIKTIVLPFIMNGTELKLDMSEYVSDIFRGFSGKIFQNMALKSGSPLENGFYKEAKHFLRNISFHRACIRYLKRMCAIIGGALLVLSEERSKKIPSISFFEKFNEGKQTLSYRFGHQLMYNLNVTNLQYTSDLFRYIDIIFIEIFNLLTSPSILWTPNYSTVLPILFEIVTYIVRFAYPFMLVVGLVCNTLALLFSISIIKLSNFSVFLLVLVVFDTLALFLNLFPTCFKFYYHFFVTNNGYTILPSHLADVYHISTISCKLLYFFVGFSRALSGWTMVTTAVVRLLAVMRPIQWRHKNTRFGIKIILITVLATTVATSLPLLTRHLTVFYFTKNQIRFCHRQDYGFINYTLELYINSFVFPILPVLIIFFVNSLILLTLYRSARATVLNNKNVLQSSKKSDLRITITLLIVSFSFLTLSLPYFVNTLSQLYSVYDFKVAYSGITDGKGAFFNYEVYIVTLVLTISNVINLFVYLLSGKSWRRKFVNVIKSVIRIKGRTI